MNQVNRKLCDTDLVESGKELQKKENKRNESIEEGKRGEQKKERTKRTSTHTHTHT